MTKKNALIWFKGMTTGSFFTSVGFYCCYGHWEPMVVIAFVIGLFNALNHLMALDTA